MNVLMARPLENKANLHLVVLLALLKTKRCQALPALLGVFQQSLGLTETGGITLACSPEDEWQGHVPHPRARGHQGGHPRLCRLPGLFQSSWVSSA